MLIPWVIGHEREIHTLALVVERGRVPTSPPTGDLLLVMFSMLDCLTREVFPGPCTPFLQALIIFT